MGTGTLSERAVLNYLVQAPDATVQQVAEHFELSGSTVANIVGRLVDRQMVVRCQEEAEGTLQGRGQVRGQVRGRGRPAVLYRPALPGPVVVASLDGSLVAAALFDRDAAVCRSETSPLARVNALADVVTVIVSLVQRLLDGAGCGSRDLAMIVIAANAIRTRRGTLSSSVLPWVSEDLPAAVQAALGVRTAVAAAAQQNAEFQHVDDPGMQTMVRLHVGDGVSSHAMIHGRKAPGLNDLAGELGHITLDPHGPRCGCGKHGCIEAMVSGPAIHGLFRREMQAGDVATGLDRSVIDGPSPRRALDEIYQQWGDADRLVRRVMNPVLDRLAWSLALVLNLLDPDLVRVDGYVLRDRPLWLAELEQRVRPQLLRGDSRQVVLQNARASLIDQQRAAAYQAALEMTSRDQEV